LFYETRKQTLEKERPNEMEMAEKATQRRKAQKKDAQDEIAIVLGILNSI